MLALSLVPAACIALLACAPWIARTGLTGVFIAGTEFGGPPFAVEQAAPLWIDQPATRSGARLPDAFTVRWMGAIAIDEPGEYRFALRSDDGSWLMIDGATIIDNGGPHGPLRVERTQYLSRGVHRLEVRYSQYGGPRDLLVLWAPPGEAWRPLDGAPLYARAIPWWRHRITSIAGAIGPWLFGLCGVGLTLAAGALLWRIGWSRLPGPSAIPRSLVLVLVLAGGLALVGLDWGLADGWAPDEIPAIKVIDGASRAFSHGWFDAYPPLQFYVLTLTLAPTILADARGVFTFYTYDGVAVAQAACRLVSVAMFLVLIAAVHRTTRMFGTGQDGVLAALMVALIAPLSFYGKTVNFDVPYLFWFVLSLPCWLALRQPDASLTAHIALAATATCAVCTKDQAYGYYALLPVALLAARWRDHRGSGWRSRLVRTLGDRRIWAAALTSLVLFTLIHNLPFNLQGFRDHVALITGGHSQGFQMFPRTWLGHLQLAAYSTRLVGFAMGWPLFLVCAAGLVAVLDDRVTRPAVLWLLLPAVSYTLTFTHVVLYSYDRFELGWCIVLAIAAAPALGRWWRRDRAWAPRTAIGAACVIALLDAASVGAMMAGDTRRSVAGWALAHLEPGARVGALSTRYYLPHLPFQRVTRVPPVPAAIERSEVDYLVVNDRYAARLGATPGGAAALAGLADGTLGFERRVQHRTPPPWWAILAHRPAFTGAVESGYTNLDKINPSITIYRRRASAPDGE